MLADEIENARKFFVESYNYSQTVNCKLLTKSWLGRIEVIKNYKFEWEVNGEGTSFKKLWEECKNNLWLTDEDLADRCAEYLVSEMVNKAKKGSREDLEFAKLHLVAFSLLNGCLLYTSPSPRDRG